MEAIYKNIKTEDTNEDCVSFQLTTRKGNAMGVFLNNRIYVHFVSGQDCMKGLMSVLIKRFACREITFTPLVNDNIKRVVKGGVVKVCKKDDPSNPFKEDFEYLETTWRD